MATNTRAAKPKTIDVKEAELTEDEILAGVPALRPVTAFRQRDRSRLMRLQVRLSDIADEAGMINLADLNSVDRALDVFADADEFFETIAVDHDAYVAWSTGLKDSEQIFGALIAKYSRAVGE